MFKLYELTGMFNDIANLIKDDVENEDLEKALRQIETNIEDKTNNTIKLIKNLEGNAKALRDEERSLAKKRRSLENRIDSLKQYLESQLMALDSRKVRTDLFSVWIQKNPPSVKIIDEDNLPEQYVSYQKRIDRQELINDLREGKEIEGAELRQTESIRFR